MNHSIFFRLLDSPIESKGADLLQQITLYNQGTQPEKTYLASPEDFGSIPGSPFAYWAKPQIRELFKTLPSLTSSGFVVQHGASTKNDYRFLRLYWEVSVEEIGKSKRWINFAKGGGYSPYYSDLHLIINWENDAEEIKDYLIDRYPYLDGKTDWILHPENFYFFSGLTWPRRTNGFSPRILPPDCIFADKGPSVFRTSDEAIDLMALLAILNTSSFLSLLQLQLARTELAQSYEVGLVEQTPIPSVPSITEVDLISLGESCYTLARILSTFDETTHVFRLPALLAFPSGTLAGSIASAAEQEADRRAEMAALQGQIDTRVAALYGLSSEAIEPPAGDGSPNLQASEAAMQNSEEDGEEEEEPASSTVLHPPSLASDLLMWCVGAAFGRWDVRFALNPDLLPALPGPFDPLPRCSPGMLLGPDGLPATQGRIVSEAWLCACPNVLALPEQVDGPETIPDQDYPLPIAWDGILVDEPDHPRDIVAGVRRVLRLIWQDQADAIEEETCQILEVADLRTYFRDPKLFFNYHIKRYSKSRRKAPIYWLLQSAKRSYGIWLYYPRLNPDMLFTAGRDYMDAKLNLETSRMDELKSDLTGLTGTGLKTRERQVARQAGLLEELKAFGKELDRVALMELKPDLNDGVLLNLAPLYNLVPWKEAEKAWKELTAGKYPWSSIGQQLQQKGWVKK